MTEFEKPTATSEVKRPEYVPDRATLIEHIREVGKRIIADADRIAPQPSVCRCITISATIAPATEVTCVDYSISEYADPRVRKVGDEA